MPSLNPLNGILGDRKAKHLLRRASFNYTQETIKQFASLPIASCMQILNSNNANNWEEPYDPYPTSAPDGYWTSSTAAANSFQNQGRKRKIITSWWWHNAMQQTSLKHKMTFFLHTSFTVSKDNGAGSSTHFYDHIQLLEHVAFGNLKTLAKKITFDNSMLMYLDNTTNNASNPNENYAREFLELFTILKGPQIAQGNYTNYTEHDVQQAAKVFSGIKTKNDRTIIDQDTGLPMGRIVVNHHDQNDKQFSDAFQKQTIQGKNTKAEIFDELDAFVEMIFNQEATAISFCRKLYRYFVKSEWDNSVENDIIIPLATELKAGNYELLPIVNKLLSSEHFFDTDDSNTNDNRIGAIVKSPLQLISEVVSYFKAPLVDPNTNPLHYFTFFNFVHSSFLTATGMNFFSPDSVAGYPAHYQEPDFDRQWFSSNTILARYKMIECLLTGKDNIRNGRNIRLELDIVNHIKNNISDPSNADTIVLEICNVLYPENIDLSRKNYFASFLLEGFPSYYWSDAWSQYLANNDQTVVKTRLNALVAAIINAPEFQLM